MRRPRGPGGRFLTADEIAAQKAAQAQAHNEHDDDLGDGDIDGDGSAEPEDDHIADIKKDHMADSRFLSLQIPPPEKIKQNPLSPISPFQQTSPHPGMPTRGMYIQQQQILHPYGSVQRTPTTLSAQSPSHAAPNSAMENATENESLEGSSGGVTLRAPYGGPSSQFYPSQDQPSNSSGANTTETPIDNTASQSAQETDGNTSTRQTGLHHVPHPHSHHSRMHPRHTHVHGQPHPTESGGLYTPFNIPMPVDLQIFGMNMGMSGVNGQGMNGMSGVNGSGMDGASNPDELNLELLGLGGSVHPGEVRVGGSGVTPSVTADLQRRTDEILAFSARHNLGGS